jgi:hypothetical protein
VELSQMQNFHRLSLGACDDLFDNFPVQMELRNLKRLSVSGTHIPGDTSSPFFVWLKSKLSSLYDLRFVDYLLDFLVTVEETRFKDNLKMLTLDSCNLECKPFGPLFQTLMLNILPRFPKMVALNLCNNNIKSIHPVVVDMLENERKIPSTLCVLGLYGNPVMENIKDDPKEKEAVMSLLKTFNMIYNLGGACFCPNDTDIDYELSMNHAGRDRVVGEGVGNGDRSIPLSLWPKILERAYEKFHQIHDDGTYYPNKKQQKDARGMYYLLREGLALIGRPELGSGGGGGMIDNDEKKKNSFKQKDPKKRKISI